MEENNTNKKGYQLVSGEKQEFDNVQLRVTAERKGMGEGI